MSLETIILIGLSIIEGLVGVILIIMSFYLKWLGKSHLENRDTLIRVETRLEGLDDMKKDIISLKHKANDLDKGLDKERVRLNGFETMLTRFLVKMEE